MKIRLILIFFLFSIIPLVLIGQDPVKTTNDIVNEDFSYFLANVSYINDNVFMGRRDSIAAPYLFPSIGYYNKSGFFADASLSFLTGPEANRVDLFLLSTGYNFNLNKFSGGISGTAYFFNEESFNVMSSVLGDLTGIVSYDFEVMESSFSLTSYFNDGSSTDIITGLMLDRTFYAINKNLMINPSISLYAGTQHFYQQYYSSSRLGNRKGNGMGNSGSESAEPNMINIDEVEKFKVLNIELAIPLHYNYRHFFFSFYPMMAFPQSSATIINEDTIVEEDLKPVFYWSAGISYWFKS
ncbi:MAG: hypothetical protein WBN63_14900 [Eudoraea sp.]|uniref:hypothetical protein n=1 Tax=Eudoraea sp. TaxID=1979955 RepID=UPI003C788478